MTSSVSSTHVGKYRLAAQLGSGGMADVFLGVDERLAVSKLVVVKRVRSHLADDAELCALLLEEARVSARLNHPNVVQMLDVGTHEDECFLAMEYLDGQSLSQVMKRAGPALPSDAVLVVLTDVLRALQYAHELVDFDGTPLSIVHRDVSPQNVFITYDGQVKLLDFGIAKAAGRATETRQGFLRGKIRYMPPEQALGAPVDGRSDIFAAGVLVWQAVTGQRFWGEASDPEVMSRLASQDYEPSPRRVFRDVPPAIDAICCRALAADVDQRYATAGAMLADLEDYVGNRIVELRKTLTGVMRDVFAKDREKRCAIIEELGSASNIASSLGAIVLRNSGTVTTHSRAVALDITTTTTDAPDETRSLANMLEPSLARERRQKRTRPIRFLIVGLAVAVLAVGVAATAKIRIRASTSRASASATIEPETLAIAYASEGLTRTRIVPVVPAPPHGAGLPTKSTATKPAQASRQLVGGGTTSAARRAPASPPVTPAPARAPTKAGALGVDKSDPWH